jgi:hypothetical protein
MFLIQSQILKLELTRHPNQRLDPSLQGTKVFKSVNGNFKTVLLCLLDLAGQLRLQPCGKLGLLGFGNTQPCQSKLLGNLSCIQG